MSIKKYILDHLPGILTGVAIFGAAATPVTAVAVTPKALDALDEAYLSKGEPLTKIEVVKVAGKYYIPSIISGAVTIACIFGANSAHLQKETALAATATFLEKRYSEYRDKNIELYGNEADEKIQKEIAKDHISNNPPPGELVSMARDSASYVIWEPITKQWFTMNDKELNWFERQLNHAFSRECPFSVNSALKMVPGAITNKPEGDMFVWWGDDDYFDFMYYNESFFGRPYMTVDLIPIEGSPDQYEMSFSYEPIIKAQYDKELFDKEAEKSQE